jgi:hypothetical protein
LSYIRMHDDSISSSVALPFDMFLLTDLDLLIQYGPEFLSRDEIEEQLKRRFCKYYRTMAQRFIEHREKAYWKFHQQGLKKLGYPFSFPRVLYETFHEVVLHPKWAFKTIYQSTKSKWVRPKAYQNAARKKHRDHTECAPSARQ